jgi:hypothetical protein
MPALVLDEERRVATERLSKARRFWSDIAIPRGNRLSFVLPSDLLGHSVQVFFLPAQDEGLKCDEAKHNNDDSMSAALASLPDNYSCENWNGYGEKPLNDSSYRHAMEFADALPLSCRNADVGIDADGEVTFEWYRSNDCQCSLTFAESGNVYCVVRHDGDRVSAVVSSRSVEKILGLIGGVVNA